MPTLAEPHTHVLDARATLFPGGGTQFKLDFHLSLQHYMMVANFFCEVPFP